MLRRPRGKVIWNNQGLGYFCSVNKLLAPGLLGIFLLSSIASSPIIAEFGRIPALLEHFRQHRQSDPGLTFFGYLHLHYSPIHTNHLSQSDHSKLPLKGAGNTHFASHLQALPPGFTESSCNPVAPASTFAFLYSPTSSLLADIWQPPRLS
jgi:hypothetical protein